MKTIAVSAKIMLKDFSYQVMENHDIEIVSKEKPIMSNLQKFPQIINFENFEASIEFNRFLIDKYIENNFNINSTGQEISILRIKSLKNSIMIFLNWITDNQIDWKAYHHIKYELPIYQYRNHLIDLINIDQIIYSTANTYLADVRMLYEWAKSRELIKELPFSYTISYIRTDNTKNISSKISKAKIKYSADIKIPKRFMKPSNKQLSAYSDDEYKLLINSEYCQTPARKLWIKLAKEYGLRRMEIVNLNQDILNDSFNGCYTVIGKFQKTREIYFKKDILKEIEEYSNNKTRKLALNKYYEINGYTDSAPLFLNNKGSRINVTTLTNIIYPVKAELELKDYVFNKTFHDLRATYAVNRLLELLKKGFDLEDMRYILQDELGHTLYETTKRYLRVQKVRDVWSDESGASEHLSNLDFIKETENKDVLNDFI